MIVPLNAGLVKNVFRVVQHAPVPVLYSILHQLLAAPGTGVSPLPLHGAIASLEAWEEGHDERIVEHVRQTIIDWSLQHHTDPILH